MSSDRITRSDLERALVCHTHALESIGALGAEETIHLSIGSATNGNSYGLYVRRPDSSGHFNPPVGGAFLGMTARDAYTRLTERTRAIHDTADAIRRAAS